MVEYELLDVHKVGKSIGLLKPYVAKIGPLYKKYNDKDHSNLLDILDQCFNDLQNKIIPEYEKKCLETLSYEEDSDLEEDLDSEEETNPFKEGHKEFLAEVLGRFAWSVMPKAFVDPLLERFEKRLIDVGWRDDLVKKHMLQFTGNVKKKFAELQNDNNKALLNDHDIVKNLMAIYLVLSLEYTPDKQQDTSYKNQVKLQRTRLQIALKLILKNKFKVDLEALFEKARINPDVIIEKLSDRHNNHRITVATLWPAVAHLNNSNNNSNNTRNNLSP